MAIWADATFVWNPGDASNASFDEVSSTDAAGITEGTFISSPRDGREYDGAVASRFDDLVAAANPQTTGMTLMAAVRAPIGNENLWAISALDKDETDQYTLLGFQAAADAWNAIGGYRNGGSSGGQANWPRPRWDGSFDSDVHIAIERYVVSGSNMLIDLFIDGTLYASDLESIIGNIDMDRITVGRLDDASPSNSTGGQVFAAATWDRPLTDSEIRALSSDPYSYPSDPSDPDDWEEGAIDTEWEDVAFYWDPNHAGDRGKNRLYGGGLSEGGLSEGSEITVDSTEGRQYNGAQGSRFNIIPLNLANRFANIPQEHTVMVAVARPGVTSEGGAFWVGDQNINDYYSLISWDDAAEQWWADVRAGGSALGSNWLRATIAGTDADTDIHVIVARFDASTGTLEEFLDALATTDSDTQSFSAANELDRLTVGRFDDSSPDNAVDMQVFAAAYWPRKLTDDEVTAVLADPYGFPGEAPPAAPSNPAAATLTSSSIRVTWDDVADETGYRVERSDDGSTGWTDVSGNLAADTTSYDDIGLDANTEYFYRVIAFNDSGDSDPSSVVSATTEAASSGAANRIGGTGAIRRSPTAHRASR